MELLIQSNKLENYIDWSEFELAIVRLSIKTFSIQSYI